MSDSQQPHDPASGAGESPKAENEGLAPLDKADRETKALIQATLSEMASLEEGWDFKPDEWEDDLAARQIAWFISYRTPT